MGIKQRATEKPLMATLFSLAAGVTATMAVWSGVQFADDIILTQAEAQEIHSKYDKEIDNLVQNLNEQQQTNTCRWLSDRVDSLQYEVYVLKRDDASPDFIQSKVTQLDKIPRKFAALNCASLVL